jgi:uncharacterized protein (TIGR02271 family)
MTELTRNEEELLVASEPVDAGSVRAQKRTEIEHVSEVVGRGIQEAEVERLPVGDGDSGEIETLPDGSVSIPLFEERLVITKQLVVRERVVIRTRTVTEAQRVEAELMRERIEIDADEGMLETERRQEEHDVRT